VFGNKLMRTLNTPRWLLQASSAYAAGERLRILTTASINSNAQTAAAHGNCLTKPKECLQCSRSLF
jgi:hypothetical protein